jgi:hypothetical protein
MPQQLGYISAAADGSVFGVSIPSPSNILQLVSGTDDNWKTLATSSPLAVLSATSGKDVWALDGAGNIFRQNGDPANWNPQAVAGGPLQAISAAQDGTVWGITTAGVPVRYSDGSGWQSFPSAFKPASLAVQNSQTVYGLDGKGNVYAYNPDEGWAELPAMAGVVSLAVGADGAAWGITSDGHAALWTGEAWFTTGALVKQLAVISGEALWAIDNDGNAVQMAGPTAHQEGMIHRPVVEFWDAESVFDETRSTHLWIVNRAASLLIANFQGSNIDFKKLLNPGAPKSPDNSFRNNMCQGLYDCDFLSPYNGPTFFSQETYASHFYSVQTGLNWWNSDRNWTAVAQGEEHFWKSLEAYETGDVAGSGYHFGLALHYFTDLTQPMHSSNFTYLSSSEMGYHTGFESFVMVEQGSVNPTPSFMPGNLPDPASYYLNAAIASNAKYFPQISIDNLVKHYDKKNGLNRFQQDQLRPLVAPMLTDAIQQTAQMMHAWAQRLGNGGAGKYVLFNYATGFVMDGSDQNKLQQAPWNNSDNQKFYIRDPNAGFFEISCVAQSSLVVQPDPTNPLRMKQATKTNADDQQWAFNEKEGKVIVANKTWTASAVVTVPPPIRSANQPLTPGSENSGAQKWIKAPAGEVYTITPSAYPDLAIDIKAGSSSPGPLWIYSRNGSPSQNFLFVLLGGENAGYSVLIGQASGLAVVGGSYLVCQEQWFGSDAQMWQTIPVPGGPDGQVLLRNKASGFFLLQAGSGVSGDGFLFGAGRGVPWTLLKVS